MTNSKLIRKTIKDRGLKIGYVAEKMGLSHYGLQKKMDNKTEFKVSEIEAFCHAVGGIPKDDMFKIFFADEVDYSSTTMKAV